MFLWKLSILPSFFYRKLGCECRFGCSTVSILSIINKKVGYKVGMNLFYHPNIAHLCLRAINCILKFAIYLQGPALWATDGADGKSRPYCFPSIVVCWIICIFLSHNVPETFTFPSITLTFQLELDRRWNAGSCPVLKIRFRWVLGSFGIPLPEFHFAKNSKNR